MLQDLLSCDDRRSLKSNRCPRMSATITQTRCMSTRSTAIARRCSAMPISISRNCSRLPAATASIAGHGSLSKPQCFDPSSGGSCSRRATAAAAATSCSLGGQCQRSSAQIAGASGAHAADPGGGSCPATQQRTGFTRFEHRLRTVHTHQRVLLGQPEIPARRSTARCRFGHTKQPHHAVEQLGSQVLRYAA